MIYLTRREHFAAAHKLWNPNWDETENQRVFGACANPNGHGHNYTLWVTVKGEINPETGFVVNLKDLRDLMRKAVIDQVDHKNLDLDGDFMQGKISSTENLCMVIWQALEKGILALGATLHEVKIAETENNTISYFG